ncbi:MAG: hypothetical protein HUU60_00735 [Armatimonadetes bacterium]|nr:hypothetical protein [Armatimonadota bacterium]
MQIGLPLLGRLLRRRWPLILGAALLCMGLTLLALSRIPPVYESFTRLLVEKPAGTPQTNVGSILGVGVDTSVDTELVVMVTPSVLEPVRKQFAPDEPLKKFSKRFSPVRVKGSDIVDFRAQDNDPKIAADLANAVTDSYLKRTRELQEANPDLFINRYKKEMDDKQRELEAVDRDLADFLAKVNSTQPGAAAPEEWIQSLIDRHANIVNQSIDINAKLRGFLREQAALEAQIAKQPENEVTGMSMGIPPEIQGLSTNMAALMAKRAGMLEDFQPDAPEIKAIDAEIAGAQRQIDDFIKRTVDGRFAVTAESVAPNAIRKAQLERYLQAKVEVDTHQGLLSRLNESLSQVTAQLGAAPTALRDYRALLRQQEAAQQVWAQKVALFEQTRVQKMTGRVNLVPVEQAAIPDTQIYPRPVLSLALALLVGLMLGIMAAYLMESNDRRIVDRWSAERLLGVPVIMEINGSRDQTAVQPIFHAFAALGGGQSWHYALVAPLEPTSATEEIARAVQEGANGLNGSLSTSTEIAPINGLVVRSSISLTDPDSTERLMAADRIILLATVGREVSDPALDLARWLHPRLLGVALVHPSRNEART